MKHLNKITTTASSEPDLIIEKQQARIEFLEDWLSKVLIRSDQKRKDDINYIVQNLTKCETGMLTIYVQDQYGHKYFGEECDPQFKKELASSLLNLIKSYYPNYKNELLEGIENGTSEYCQNYVYVENKK